MYAGRLSAGDKSSAPARRTLLYGSPWPFRLVEIFQTLTAYKLEPKRMKLVYPFVDKEPNMVMIEAIRGARSMIKVEEPLIVYKEPGVYHDVIYDIYGY